MPPCPSPLGLDVLRATLGPVLAAPYGRAFGPVPWLTAGTLTWADEDLPRIAAAWDAWDPGAPTAIRRIGALVAVDVALTGDPAGALLRIAPLRALDPAGDTVGTASPAVLTCRAGGAPAALVGVTAALAAGPAHAVLAGAPPAGVSLGVRRAGARRELLGVGIAADAARVRAAVDRAARRLAPPAPDLTR